LQGAIFDLDGVVVDTAKFHYLAWKRLANQIGIDFTAEDNEVHEWREGTDYTKIAVFSASSCHASCSRNSCTPFRLVVNQF